MDGPAPPVYMMLLRGVPDGFSPSAWRKFQLVSLMPTDAAVDAEYEEVFE